MALGLTPQQILEKGNHSLLRAAPHWERVLLGEIADVQNGAAFKSKYFTQDTGLPLIRIRDVGKATTDNHYEGPYDEEYLVYPGDIIIGMDGDFNAAIWSGDVGLLNQRVCRLNIRSALVDRNFLFCCLQPFLDAINAETSSVTVKHLSSRTVAQIPLPLPPLNEQRRIVAKIEELYSELDKGVESLKTARAQLKTYRQSLLKAAFEGRLTEQWRRDNADKLETADQLLQRIREECEAQYQRKLENWKAAVNEWDATDTVSAKPRTPSNIKDVPDFTVEERADLCSLPPSWAWTRFGSLGVDLKRGPFGSAIKKSMFVPKGYKVYEQGNAIYRDATRGNYYINEDKFSDLIGFAVEPGDFIVSCAGTVGRIFELPDEAPPGVINQALMRIRINDRIVNRRFFEILFESDHFQRRILKDAKGTAMSNLAGIKELNLVPVSICSIEEQDEVVRHLDQEISRIEYLDSIIDESMQRSETLRQAILKRAFEGKLVPQDPDDEPASVLLERIRAEQEKAPKPRGRQRKANA